MENIAMDWRHVRHSGWRVRPNRVPFRAARSKSDRGGAPLASAAHFSPHFALIKNFQLSLGRSEILMQMTRSVNLIHI